MLCATLLCLLQAGAQTVRPPRRTTPVDVDDNKPRTVLHYYDKHGNPLPEPVRFLAVLDTVTVPKSKPLYPLFCGWSVSAASNDVLGLIRSDKYLDLSVAADVSLWNWIFPTVEAGLSKQLFTLPGGYNMNAAPYLKLGLDYNFLYKSNPDYRLFLGVRGCYSPVSYQGLTASVDGGKDPAPGFAGNLHTFYGDVVGGIRVMVTDRFSLGWNLRCHVKFGSFTRNDLAPAYVPGFGLTDGLPLSGSIVASFRFGPKPTPTTNVEVTTDK